MYYEEKVIDGVLCWRDTPDGEWVLFTPRQLTEKILGLQEQVDPRDTDQNTVAEDILEVISELNEEALFPTGMEKAVIGYTERFGQPPLALVDRGKCIEIMVKEQGMTVGEAHEFFEYNILGAWLGEGTPVFATIFVQD